MTTTTHVHFHFSSFIEHGVIFRAIFTSRHPKPPSGSDLIFMDGFPLAKDEALQLTFKTIEREAAFQGHNQHNGHQH